MSVFLKLINLPALIGLVLLGGIAVFLYSVLMLAMLDSAGLHLPNITQKMLNSDGSFVIKHGCAAALLCYFSIFLNVLKKKNPSKK